LLQRFAGFNLASGELPETALMLMILAFGDQYLVVTQYQADGDVEGFFGVNWRH
jgi:hypothetical protein